MQHKSSPLDLFPRILFFVVLTCLIVLPTGRASSQSITRISPTAGSTLGGGTLDIVGAGLTGTTGVTIGGHGAAILGVSADGSKISVAIPAGAAGPADVVVSGGGGTTTLAAGFIYVNSANLLFADDFNSGSLGNWSASPLGLFSNWTSNSDVADYNGGGHTQIFAGSGSWTDYTVQAKFQLFSSSN